MDENTIFFIALGVFSIYYSDEIEQFRKIIIKNFLEYYFNQVLNLFNSDVFEEELFVEKLEQIIEKPIVKYEDKFLTEIRKLDKEFQFDEREKETLKEKELNFLNVAENNYKNKIEEIKNRLCEIEVELTNLEEENEQEESITRYTENYKDNDSEEEEEYTKEEKIKNLNTEKSNLYVEVKNLNDLLYSEKGKQELLNKAKEFALNSVIILRVEKLLNCYVMEMTPQGNVLMIYDYIKASFRYYSDNAIPYRYLEVVGRKYVKLFNCRPLYVDMEEELDLAEKRWEKEREEKEEKEEKERKQKEENKIVVSEKKNVFAKFKSYNKEGTNGRVNVGVPPKNSISIIKDQEKEKCLLKEKANRYTYEGKLINFSFLKKIDRKIVDKKYNLSFSDFKKINKN
jgi:hypothetical protein